MCRPIKLIADPDQDLLASRTRNIKVGLNVSKLQGLAVSTFQVVLVPTLVGVVANEFFHDLVVKFTAWLPLVGVAITTLLCAAPCAQVATVLK